MLQNIHYRHKRISPAGGSRITHSANRIFLRNCVSSYYQDPLVKSDVTFHNCNLSMEEVETGRFLQLPIQTT